MFFSQRTAENASTTRSSTDGTRASEARHFTRPIGADAVTTPRRAVLGDSHEPDELIQCGRSSLNAEMLNAEDDNHHRPDPSCDEPR